HTIREFGYETAFLWFGIGQGSVIVLAGLVMRFPRADEVPAVVQPKVLQGGRDYAPLQMLRSPAFWLVFAMMTLGAVPGLLMIGQLKPMAQDFQVADIRISLFGATLMAVDLALMIDRIMGGLTRPVFGWISDHIGREVAIFLAFALEGGSLLMLILFR